MSPSSTHNDPGLVRQFAEGNEAAFETIYHQYFNSVFYFALRFVTDAQEAEDITTEIFLKCWQKHADFENLNKLQSFLYTATRNACINSLRADKRQSEKVKELLYLAEQDSGEALARQQVTATIYQYIYEEIERLPAQEKKIFKMAYIDGLSNEEIARLLNINNQSVRNNKSRALKTLRVALADKDIHHLLLIFLLCRN